jgi:putative transposase
MKKARFTETQIVKALHEEQSGGKTDDICRQLGISRATFYNWKSKYSGMEVNQLKQLRELQDENGSSKRCMLIWRSITGY